MHITALNNFKSFLEKYLHNFPKKNLKCVDIGSYDVNGTLKPSLSAFCINLGINLQYIGVHKTLGPNVDLVFDGKRLMLEDNNYDIIISSSCFEHDPTFWITFKEMCRVCTFDGFIYINAASAGNYKPYPIDCWRFYQDSWSALAEYDGTVTVIENYIDQKCDWKNSVGIFKKFDKCNKEKYITDIINLKFLNKYDFLCKNISNINEHIPTIKEYAEKCTSIIELGVGGDNCRISWILALGLLNNNNDKKKLLLNDIAPCDINELLNLAKEVNIDISYQWCNDLHLEVKIDEPVDMTYIDTWHVYGQLKRELDKFSKVTKKYIMIHNTDCDAVWGESIRMNEPDYVIKNKIGNNNFSIQEAKMGLQLAIEEFLDFNPDWEYDKVFINNNGLIILNRKDISTFVPYTIPKNSLINTTSQFSLITVNNAMDFFPNKNPPDKWRFVAYVYLDNNMYYYHNGLRTKYIGLEGVWGNYGMNNKTEGPIVQYIKSIIPNDIALVYYKEDYHIDLNLPYKFIQFNRYWGCNNAIVVPGDDNFFLNYKPFLPKVYLPFDKKINKVFWRGECTYPGRREVVLACSTIPGCDVKLVRVIYKDWHVWRTIPDHLFIPRQVDRDEFSKYKIWLSIEGWGVASDTSRALLSGSAVIYFRKTKPWFDEFLIHEENCIIIENDIPELLKYINKMIGDTEYTKKIAENGLKLAHKIFQHEFMKQHMLEQMNKLVAKLNCTN